MSNSEFMIQRVTETINRLAPIDRMSFLLSASLAIVAILFVYPGIPDPYKEWTGVIIIFYLILVINFLPGILNRSLEALLKTQTRIFFARDRIDHFDEERLKKLLGLIDKMGNSRDLFGGKIKVLEEEATKLIESNA